MKRACALLVIITGTWAMNFVYKDGMHTQGYCTFSQEGSRLTGVCGEDTTGGSRVTGEVTSERVLWQVEDGPSYTGVLDEQGTFMRGSFSNSGEGIFTAMKTKMQPK